MISDRSVDAVAHGCQKGHQGAKAVTEDGDPAGAPWQLGHSADGVFNVPDAGISVIGLIETKAVLPVGLGGHGQVDARLLTPE